MKNIYSSEIFKYKNQWLKIKKCNSVTGETSMNIEKKELLYELGKRIYRRPSKVFPEKQFVRNLG